mmetsp:Transcript_27090/g.49343  ORF Transcript_27090/g.49343 Transcript_27090/m.49343 type:complete len:268 (+) Transcript_27090:912-1715(+)
MCLPRITPGQGILRSMDLETGVDRLGRVDVFLTHIVLELVPNGAHHFDPLGTLRGRQLTHNATCGHDGGLGLFVHACGFRVPGRGHFFHDGGQLVAGVVFQAVPEVGRGHNQVVDDAVVGFGHTILHFKELLAVDVGPGVFLTVHNALLQRAVNFGEGHLLGGATHGFHLSNQHVRGLHAELQAVGVRRHVQRHVCRHLLHAVVPVAQTLQTATLHAVKHVLTVVRRLECVHGGHVFEHEWQVKQAELFGELFKLGQRRRGQLNVAL